MPIKDRVEALATAVATKIKNMYVLRGTGSPEGVVTAPVGALYERSDGTAGTSVYVKQSGAGNTGWASISPVPASTAPYAADVPAGSTNTTITHNLNTRDVQVTVYDKSSDPWEAVEIPHTVPTGGNTVVLQFGTAPTAGQYRVIVSSGSGSATIYDPVFFEAQNSTQPTLSANTFVTVETGSVITNIGGGTFNTSTYIYTIPSDGIYDCQATIRIADSVITRSLGVGIGVLNADGSHFLWGQMGGVQRDAKQYRRVTRFTAGDQVRLYIYSDSQGFPLNASNLVIRKVGA